MHGRPRLVMATGRTGHSQLLRSGGFGAPLALCRAAEFLVALWLWQWFSHFSILELVLVGKLSVGRPVPNFEGQSYGILMVNPLAMENMPWKLTRLVP